MLRVLIAKPDAIRTDRERMASANHRLQTDMDENGRTRKELEEAGAKLDAIAPTSRNDCTTKVQLKHPNSAVFEQRATIESWDKD